MAKKIMTLDNLYEFFVEQNKSFNFSSKESGSPIVVTTNGNFAEEQNDDMPGMLKLKLKNCHIDTNRNGSHISKDNMEKAMPTLKYRPILAYIHELPDGTKDFYAHNIQIEEDEDGDTQVVYLEKQVGCFTAENPWLEYDEKMDKTYVMAYAVIPEEYTEAADIIRRKNGTKVSTELVINELSYNAKEKYLDLTDFYFGATTLLGKDDEGREISEGMLGARADITDFCHKEPVFDYQEKLVEMLDKLNNTLSNFNKNNTEEGVRGEMNHFDELLEKYGFAKEDLNFDYENMSDEELDTAFEEFKNKFNDEGEPDGEDGSESGEDKGTVSTSENFVKNFKIEVSHEDIRYALYNLIAEYDEMDGDWYGIYSVYDDYFVMQGWCNGKFYKQSYSIDGENISLEGERTELFQMLLTESEKIAVDKLRSDYAELETKYNELKTFKDNYDAAEAKAKKDEVFANEAYEEIRESDEFKALVSDADKYSVEELQDKCDLLYAAHEKAKFRAFSAENGSSKPAAMRFSVKTTDEANKKPYGDLFN